MNEEIDTISQILPETDAGVSFMDEEFEQDSDEDLSGWKANAMRKWIRSVLSKITDYKAKHRRYLNEAATALEPALPKDIVFKNVLPFVELPSDTLQNVLPFVELPSDPFEASSYDIPKQVLIIADI